MPNYQNLAAGLSGLTQGLETGFNIADRRQQRALQAQQVVDERAYKERQFGLEEKKYKETSAFNKINEERDKIKFDQETMKGDLIASDTMRAMAYDAAAQGRFDEFVLFNNKSIDINPATAKHPDREKIKSKSASLDTSTGDIITTSKEGESIRIPKNVWQNYVKTVQHSLTDSENQAELRKWQILKAQKDANEPTKQGLPDYQTQQETLTELSDYLNVEPKSKYNPNGLTPIKRNAVIQAYSQGLSAGEIAQKFGVENKAESDLKIALANREQVVKNAGRWVSDRDQELLNQADAEVERAKQFNRGTNLNNMRYSGLSNGEDTAIPQGVGLGQGQPIQQPQQGAQSQAQPAFDASNVQSYDSNRDGKLDERDEAVKMALYAEANPTKFTPQTMEQVNAILTEYRKIQKSNAQKLMGTATR